MWQLMWLTDDEILQECSMDFLCFLRVMRMGWRICLAGGLTALVLMPLYSTANESQETAHIKDGILQVSIANVPSSSPRLIGTSLSAYVLFGYTMFLILHEFEFFTQQRHKYLLRRVVRNYVGK